MVCAEQENMGLIPALFHYVFILMVVGEIRDHVDLKLFGVSALKTKNEPKLCCLGGSWVK